MVVEQILKDNATEVRFFTLFYHKRLICFIRGEFCLFLIRKYFIYLLQAEVLGYLEKACQLIPDQGLIAECKEMVDDYYPILIGIITGELVSTINLFVQVLASLQ